MIIVQLVKLCYTLLNVHVPYDCEAAYVAYTVLQGF